MDSTSIFDAICEIAATSSKNAKEALVKQHSADAEFVRVLQYAYDPFKTYGIRQIPGVRVPESVLYEADNNFDPSTWAILDGLISRELSGSAARQAVEDEINRLNEKSAELFIRIIRKDLRAGFEVSTCNKAVKGLIKTFPYMRCSLPKDVPELDTWSAWISQEKADGMFLNIDHELGGIVCLTTRQGTPVPLEPFEKSGMLQAILERLTPGTQTHGEMLVIRDGKTLPRAEGNGVLNSILAGGDFEPGDRPFFMAWDQIPLSAVVPKGRFDRPYKVRLRLLLDQLPGTDGHLCVIPTRICKTLKGAYAHSAELMQAGKEGSVVKNPDGIWRDTGSSGSKDQVKLKVELNVDLEVLAIMPGSVGTKNEGRAGALRCRTSCQQLVVDVAVKNEKMRDEVDADHDNWLGRVIAVIANDVTLPSDSNELHSLFLPRMAEACFRTDKTEADSLERVLAQLEAARQGKAMKEAA